MEETELRHRATNEDDSMMNSSWMEACLICINIFSLKHGYVRMPHYVIWKRMRFQEQIRPHFLEPTFPVIIVSHFQPLTYFLSG